jgi:hypothetical protein
VVYGQTIELAPEEARNWSGKGGASLALAQRHLLDWLGYGLVVNAVARRRSRLARASQQGPQAA